MIIFYFQICKNLRNTTTRSLYCSIFIYKYFIMLSFYTDSKIAIKFFFPVQIIITSLQHDDNQYLKIAPNLNTA